MVKIINIYSKSKLNEKYSKYQITCRDGEIKDKKLYIVNGFRQQLGEIVVEVEEVEFIN